MNKTQSVPNLICVIPKNQRERVQVEFMQYDGKDVINFWVYYKVYDDDVANHPNEIWKPSKKGLSLSTDHIPDLKKAMDMVYDLYMVKTGETKLSTYKLTPEDGQEENS